LPRTPERRVPNARTGVDALADFSGDWLRSSPAKAGINTPSALAVIH
jgi:hypothetical protein